MMHRLLTIGSSVTAEGRRCNDGWSTLRWSRLGEATPVGGLTERRVRVLYSTTTAVPLAETISIPLP
jgi:hypothetical protein